MSNPTKEQILVEFDRLTLEKAPGSLTYAVRSVIRDIIERSPLVDALVEAASDHLNYPTKKTGARLLDAICSYRYDGVPVSKPDPELTEREIEIIIERQPEFEKAVRRLVEFSKPLADRGFSLSLSQAIDDVEAELERRKHER